MFKLILLGEGGVGKSSLFIRIKDNIFGESLQPTIGIDNCSIKVKVDGQFLSFSLWDTAGVERYKTITRNYYRNVHASLMVFSMDDPASLQYLSKWDEDICLNAPKAVKFLIANKCDLEKLISAESMYDFVAAHNCEDLFIVSAKTGQGIEGALQRIGEKLLDIFSTPMFLESQYNDTVEINKFVLPSKSCCQ